MMKAWHHVMVGLIALYGGLAVRSLLKNYANI